MKLNRKDIRIIIESIINEGNTYHDKKIKHAGDDWSFTYAYDEANPGTLIVRSVRKNNEELGVLDRNTAIYSQARNKFKSDFPKIKEIKWKNQWIESI